LHKIAKKCAKSPNKKLEGVVKKLFDIAEKGYKLKDEKEIKPLEI